ncbi:ABC transporter substrate-binding protein [Melghirimyces algeriensis]|uniref:Iron complex transport system substrate-binding protein n=1 Tax=Melghirimyces algeriensis TaxID=910412 RepID=A0A521DP00_9BACL|nr:ABC transporter substrate-binding protein [Melghirimyces algeriensis]SMO73454.1 iron complex transport system substrate-binding protein [Melghirimyces algeriensis]
MKQGSRILFVLFSLLLVFGVAGCTTAPGADQKSQQEQETGYPVELTDDTGKQVKIKEEPQRIVSLIPSMTETVYALERGDRVVGVTTNDDYPKEVKKVEKVGDMNVDAEKVVSLKPDLVLASSSMNKDSVKKLRKLGLTVLAYDPKNLKSVFQQTRDVGKAVGAKEEADRLIDKMKKEKEMAEKVASKVPDQEKAQVWVEVSPDLFTAGNNTFMNELITLAGGKNVSVKVDGWGQVSSEKVVKWNPEVILYTHPEKKKTIASRSGWDEIRAVKEDRIQQLDANIVNRPGPRITQGLLQICKAIYPEEYAHVVK